MLRFLLLAALFVPSAQAADLTLLSGFISKHASGDYCETNPGLGLRADSGPWSGWSAGAYRNSLCRTSVYLAKEWQWQVAGPLHVGVIAGAVTGYRYPVVPAVLPELVVRFGRVEAAVLLQPLDLEQSPAFVATQLRIRF